MRFAARSLCICLMLGAATGFAPPVCAEDRAPAPGRIDGAAVKDHLRRAKRARARGQWTEAVAAYKAAFEAADPASATERERAEIAGELGLCELALRKYRDAAEHLEWSLQQHGALSDAQYTRFSKGLREAAAFVGTLVLAVDPPDAEVIVDGKPLGRTARTHKLFFEPGRHIVRLRATGREEALHVVQAVAGAQHEIATVLPRAAVSTANETAPVKPEPVSAAPSAPAQAPGPPSSWPETLRIVGITVSMGAVSAGALLILRATSLDGDMGELRSALDSDPTSSPSACWQAGQRPACAALRDLRDARNLSGDVGAAMVIAGGVIGVITAASLFTDFSFLGPAPAQDRIRASAVVTGGEIGVRLEGTW